MNKLLLIISSVLLFSVSGVLCLKLLNLSIPPIANLNDEATLECEYDLEGNNLYSVKWYKDDSEFFNYMPDNAPSVRAIPVPGVIVDIASSNFNKVTLKDISFNTSGLYKCEVSTEAPNFATVVESAFMKVMALPRDDPIVEGILTTYLLGDYIAGNCTSQKSHPPPILTWYINDVKANSSSLIHPATDETDSQGLHTRTLGIGFTAMKHHFLGSEKTLVLRCTSTVEKMSWHRVVTSTLGPILSKNFAPERLSNRGSPMFIAPIACCLAISIALSVIPTL